MLLEEENKTNGGKGKQLSRDGTDWRVKLKAHWEMSRKNIYSEQQTKL